MAYHSIVLLKPWEVVVKLHRKQSGPSTKIHILDNLNYVIIAIRTKMQHEASCLP